ncbi:hypothetical protein SFUMM280S_00006 [Streptomyces fumanus]
MVVYEKEGWTANDRGTHTLVAARALLECFARDGDAGPVLEHLDVLRADAGLMSNFLHGLAAAGAENERLAEAARGVWPSLLRHAIGYLNDDSSPYRDHHWGDWAAAALLPDPLPWTQGLYNEVVGEPVDWVRAEDLVESIDDWLPTLAGRPSPSTRSSASCGSSRRKCRLPVACIGFLTSAFKMDVSRSSGRGSRTTGLRKFVGRPKKSVNWTSGKCSSIPWSSPEMKDWRHIAGDGSGPARSLARLPGCEIWPIMRVRRVGKGQQGREGLHSATGTRDGIEQGGNGLGVLNHARRPG